MAFSALSLKALSRRCYKNTYSVLRGCGAHVLHLTYEQLNANHSSFSAVFDFLGFETTYDEGQERHRACSSSFFLSLALPYFWGAGFLL